MKKKDKQMKCFIIDIRKSKSVTLNGVQLSSHSLLTDIDLTWEPSSPSSSSSSSSSCPCRANARCHCLCNMSSGMGHEWNGMKRIRLARSGQGEGVSWIGPLHLRKVAVFFILTYLYLVFGQLFAGLH